MTRLEARLEWLCEARGTEVKSRNLLDWRPRRGREAACCEWRSEGGKGRAFASATLLVIVEEAKDV